MIRKIVKVESDIIYVTLPKYYIGKVVEVIAFSSEEAVNKEERKRKKATFMLCR